MSTPEVSVNKQKILSPWDTRDGPYFVQWFILGTQAMILRHASGRHLNQQLITPDILRVLVRPACCCQHFSSPEIPFLIFPSSTCSNPNFPKSDPLGHTPYLAVEVLDVSLQSAFRSGRVVAVRAAVLEVTVHVRVEVEPWIAWKYTENSFEVSSVSPESNAPEISMPSHQQ